MSAPSLPFAAVRHPDFRPYFVTGLLSMMADNVEHVISYWVIFQAFHSPTARDGVGPRLPPLGDRKSP